MKTELSCACEFFARVLQSRNLPFQFVKPFSKRLEEVLAAKYRDHWHPENPRKGSAYRCIRINGKMDPVIKEAAMVTGLSNIGSYLPKEFTMWVDPNEVSYRFGEDGSISQCPISSSPVQDEDFPFRETVARAAEWAASHSTPTYQPPKHPSYFDMFSPSSLSNFERPITVQV